MTAGASDLTTVAFVKQWANITGVNDDALFQSLVTAISSYVPNVLNRQVLTAEYVDVRKGNGKDRMQLRQQPIQTISLIEWQGTQITTQVDLMSNAAGVATDGRVIFLRGGMVFPAGMPVRITYTAGWDIPPAEISMAVAEIVAEAYSRRSHIGQNSTSIGGQTTASYDTKAMHAAIADKLSNYIRVAPL